MIEPVIVEDIKQVKEPFSDPNLQAKDKD